ncbi:MAG TPA: RAMP superfamily CRISPR-associated protein, partial [Longimicrobium sp.]|nr:RAMP superfamily CRISPR-associated protein [Longimicrobium sp.]
YLPGTQIAGRLREVATRLAPALGWDPCVALERDRRKDGEGRPLPCGCRVCSLFGDRRPPEGEDAGAAPAAVVARASRLWCFDAPLERAGQVIVRDGVGIDRRTGTSAAQARALWDAEWIAAGARFTLRLELEHGASVDDEVVLALALSEWVEGRGRIGRGASRGGGAFTLEGGTFRRATLETVPDLLAFLHADALDRGAVVEGWLDERLRALRADTSKAGFGHVLPAGATGSFVRICFDLCFRGPVLVNDPVAALAHGLSFAPVFAGSAWERPVLPGASLRGVLRAQVERIARTLAARQAAASPEAAAGFARLCAACSVFVTAAAEKENEHHALRSCAERAEAHGREDADPAEAEERCLGCTLFGSTRIGSRLRIADAELGDKAAPVFRLRDFVAIDRFTGGALEHAKFDALPLYDPVFRVSMELEAPDASGWELGALALALRDLDDGLATVGAHGSRGFGRARVEGVELRLGRIGVRGPEPLPDAVEVGWSGVFRRVDRAPCDAAGLVSAAREAGWIDAFVTLCREVERREDVDPATVQDDYFGRTLLAQPSPVGMEALYPLTVDLAELEEAHG